MELIEISDESLIPINNGQNLILQQMPLQGFTPTTQFVNDGFGGVKIIDSSPLTSTQYVNGSYVQLIDNNPGNVVSYVYGTDGSLIPVYDNFSLDNNTFTIIGGGMEPPAEQTVPPHILDHMYAKKPKEPGSETPSRPRKRAKKKEPVEKAEFIVPEDYISNTTKVNIIRKGLPVTTTATFRPLMSRPKILQTKAGSSNTAQKSAGLPGAVNSVSQLITSTSAALGKPPAATIKVNSDGVRTYNSRVTPQLNVIDDVKVKSESEETSSTSQDTDNTFSYYTTSLTKSNEFIISPCENQNINEASDESVESICIMLPPPGATETSTEAEPQEVTYHLTSSSILDNAATDTNKKEETVLTLSQSGDVFDPLEAMDVSDAAPVNSESTLQLGGNIYFAYS